MDDEELVKTGFSHYDEMCAGCHGAPGADPAEGFNPSPPDLSEDALKFRPAEALLDYQKRYKDDGNARIRFHTQ